MTGSAGLDDWLQFDSGGAIASGAFANVRGIERVVLSDQGNSFVVAQSLVDSSNNANSRTHVLTIIGGAGNDVVDGSALTGHAKLDITAGGGDDVLKGGAYTDYFRFAGDELTAGDTVSGGGLRDAGNQLYVTSGGTVDLANVSNVAVNLSAQGNSVLVSNNFAASISHQGVFGNAGNDVIDAAGVTSGNGLQLLGYGGGDVLTGGNGADYLSGGTGADMFRFIARGGGVDQVADFSHADGDKLAFATAAFDYNGAAFDSAVTASSTATDITGADLVNYTGLSGTATVDAVKAYLAAAAGGSVDEGVFVYAGGALFHAVDASFTHSTDVVEVATLAGAGSALALGDFSFF